MQSHIRKVYACLAVTCHLRFWQNDRGLLRATAVTRGWNGYRNKSQHRKLTLEKKILPPLQQGFKPATFRSRVRRSNHWAIPAPIVDAVSLSVQWSWIPSRCQRVCWRPSYHWRFHWRWHWRFHWRWHWRWHWRFYWRWHWWWHWRFYWRWHWWFHWRWHWRWQLWWQLQVRRRSVPVPRRPWLWTSHTPSPHTSSLTCKETAHSWGTVLFLLFTPTFFNMSFFPVDHNDDHSLYFQLQARFSIEFQKFQPLSWQRYSYGNEVIAEWEAAIMKMELTPHNYNNTVS